jgi:hypothetical protein
MLGAKPQRARSARVLHLRHEMSWLLRLIAVSCSLAGPGLTSAEAAPQQQAGSTASPPAAAAQAGPQTGTRRQPVEPDVALVNLPTTMSLPAHKSSFRLTHRFVGNLRRGSFTDNLGGLFGLDSGAIIGLEFRFAPIRRAQVIVFRTNLDKTFQFSGRYDLVRQGGARAFSSSAIVSIEGTNNFRSGPAEAAHTGHQHGAGGEGHRSPAVGAVVSRTIGDRLALYMTPVWVHHTLTLAGEHQNASFVGLGGRLRLTQKVYVVWEASPRTSGEAQGTAEYAFGIEKRMGGHMFQLTFTNAFSTTFGQLATGGTPGAIYMGFNLGRKFY